MYHMIDALVKEMEEVFIPLFQRDIKSIFLKDIKDAFLKENHELSKSFLILFLTWEGYFSSEFQNQIVDKIYEEGIYKNQIIIS